jgi:putative glutamine amidotransferase
VVGITSYVETAKWGVWEATAALVPHRYVEKVAAAGGVPVVLPPVAAASPEVLERLDALVLAGGSDVDPARYGAEPHPATSSIRPDRDEGELALLPAALERDLPILGVCRGMQLMTVAHGGTLQQHVPDVVGHDGHRPSPGVYGAHPVRLAPGSLAHRTLGDATSVSSYHHQGVASPGSLTVTGWSDDELIEAVEIPGHRFALGVLWHPEVGDDERLFAALVAAASTTGSH